MTFVFSGRKIELTDAMKERVQKKLSKLDKYFQTDSQANIRLSLDKNRYKIEVTIQSNAMILRAQEENEDLYASIDKIVDTLERQIRKNKTKLEKRLRSGAFEDWTPSDQMEEDELKITKAKHFDVKPMDQEEALLQMNLLGHSFYVFKDAQTLLTCVVYKRNDGNYGVIEVQ